MYTVRQQKSISAFQSFVGSTEFTRKDIVRFTKETGENKKLGVIGLNSLIIGFVYLTNILIKKN